MTRAVPTCVYWRLVRPLLKLVMTRAPAINGIVRRRINL